MTILDGVRVILGRCKAITRTTAIYGGYGATLLYFHRSIVRATMSAIIIVVTVTITVVCILILMKICSVSNSSRGSCTGCDC